MPQFYEKITTKAANSCCLKQEKRSPDSSQQQIHDQQPAVWVRLGCLGSSKQENHQQMAQDTDPNKVPHNYREILKSSDLDLNRPLFKTSDKMIIQQLLYDGVFLSDRKVFYWVDKKKNNCFRIFPNNLMITSSDNPNGWYLHTAQTSDLGKITVAKLRPGVVKLEIEGRFKTRNLSPGVKYQVKFLIMLEYTSEGWEEPVSVKLTLPNGEIQEPKEEDLKDKPKVEWLPILVGDEFQVSPKITGEIEFSLYQNGNKLKKGLIIKCVIIEPKYPERPE